MVRPRHLGGRGTRRARLSPRNESAPRPRLERRVSDTVTLRAGTAALDDWRAIYRGAAVALDPACRPAVEASAAAVAALVAKHEPIYGINTGFGRLASVRIDDSDITALQRNIVLSHAAGVGEPTPIPVVRLIMALKMANLAQGASGVRPETVECLSTLLTRG